MYDIQNVWVKLGFPMGSTIQPFVINNVRCESSEFAASYWCYENSWLVKSEPFCDSKFDMVIAVFSSQKRDGCAQHP